MQVVEVVKCCPETVAGGSCPWEWGCRVKGGPGAPVRGWGGSCLGDQPPAVDGSQALVVVLMTSVAAQQPRGRSGKRLSFCRKRTRAGSEPRG